MNAFLAKIYAYKFFDDLVFIYPLYAVMFSDFGLTAFQIGVILTVWSIAAFVLEVPSGVFADKYSRKHILFFAQLVRIAGYATWLLFPNFFGFLVGFILWGIKSAFTSGTFEALVFDELKKFGREKEFTKVIGRARSLALIAILVASVGASGAIALGYPFVLSISILSLFASSIAIILLPKAAKTESTQEKGYFALLKTGLSNSIKNPIILRLIIFISLSLALGGALDEFWPLFGSEAGLPKYAIGIFIGAMSGVQAIGSAIAYKFEKFQNHSFYTLFILNGILLLIAALTFKQYSVLFLIVFSFLFKIMDTIFEGKLQHAIPTETRATISSVKGFFTEIGAIGVYMILGAVASAYSYQNGFMIFGFVIVSVGLIYLLTSFRKNLPPELKSDRI